MKTHTTDHPAAITAVRLLAASLLALTPLLLAPTAYAADARTSTRTELQQAPKQSAQALEAMKSYTAAQRHEALTQGKELMDAMDERIDRLAIRTQNEWGQLSQQARQQRQESMHSLRQQRDDVAQWYGGIRHSSAAAWDEVRQGFVDAYGALSRSFGDAVAQFDTTAGAQKQQP